MEEEIDGEIKQKLYQIFEMIFAQLIVEGKNKSLADAFFPSNSSPAYISELLTVDTTSKQLCSSTDTNCLKVPYTNTKSFGQRYFSFAGQIAVELVSL